MIRDKGGDARRPKQLTLQCDLAVAGGGLAGFCTAVTAARAGIRVVLVQDRPVLGGNASSEVRLWILGATAHMGNNNRWAREGGVVNEIMVENLHRNPEGNPLIVDAILLEMALAEKNLTVLLNTSVLDLEKSGPDTIASMRAWCSQNSTEYIVRAPLFCDASGDGILGFLAGAAFRMGAESREEFDEGFAPDKAVYGELLGHSMYFYSKDTGKPVRFVPPSFALKDITKIPRYRNIHGNDTGCRLWWLEWGGRIDTVHDTEAIKWELWKVVYGVWDYIKNSGKFPETETMTLEWVGTIPGKRESRRFEGDYMLTQKDVIEQRTHADAVSFGGWAIDLHPADGVYSPLPSCTQWHAKGVYQIPYRCLYSRNIHNLFLAGRITSVSHVAFGTTRVMGTGSHAGQAVGMAAALCRKHGVMPRNVPLAELQRNLLRAGQYIPGVALSDDAELGRKAAISSSSTFDLAELKPNGNVISLEESRAMLLPVPQGALPAVTFTVDAARDTTLEVEVRGAMKPANYTPEVVLHKQTFKLAAGKGQAIRVAPTGAVDSPRYVAYCLLRNPDVAVHLSDMRVTGVLSLSQSYNKAVARAARQVPPEGSGIESFELWLPRRRPGGKNLAIKVTPLLRSFDAANVLNGFERPTTQPNAWVASPSDKTPRITLRWNAPRKIARVVLAFDSDFDHPMESVLMGHPERDIPFCVRSYRIMAGAKLLHECAANHQTRAIVKLEQPVTTDELSVEVLTTHGAPAALFAVRCYAE